MAPQPPLINRRVLEALLRLELPGEPDRRLVLVHGRYEPGGPTEFVASLDDAKRRVRVVEQHSVLGISDAWHRHAEVAEERESVLVVATAVADDQLGWDLRGHALRRQVLNVDRTEIVRLRFGATDLDPRIRAASWLVNALLEAEPPRGWPRAGSVLTLDAAMRALVEARLSMSGADDDSRGTHRETPLDADALLSWSRSPVGPARFAALTADERNGITTWLTKVVGEAASLLLQLCAAGRGQEAMALGVVGSVLAAPGLAPDTGLALGGLFGTVRPKTTELQAFTTAVEGTLTRWLVQAEQAGPQQYAIRDLALQVLEQADQLAAEAGLSQALAHNAYLPSGFQARLGSLAEALTNAARSVDRDPRVADAALDALRQHHLARLLRDRVRTAEAAVRLVRWTAEPGAAPDSVAAAVHGHLAQWGWVDASLTVLWAGDADAAPAVSVAYRTVYHQARERRTALDRAFAGHLKEWTRTAGSQTPAGALLVEDVLARIALPLIGKDRPSPLILVVDGMSSAVAVGFGIELARRGWLEASPATGTRAAAIAAIPSLTRLSRASLLTGTLTSGGQSVEKDGFTRFWSRQRRVGVLFHKAEIGGVAGQRLADDLQRELAGESVVGVVLNTVDDSLDHAAQGDRTGWRIADVTYLEELLSAARLYGRPVVLVADHGHVLERGEGQTPTVTEGASAARWRIGEPQDGEVLLTGPRVLEGGGTVVTAWREDIRYTPRKAGYHGGAALAEMVVPVLVLLPSTELLPKTWTLVVPEKVTPRWWGGTPETLPTVPPSATAAKDGQHTPASQPPQENAPASADRLAVADVAAEPAPPTPSAAPETLGERLVASEVFASQRQYVRRPPDADTVAAVVDALAAADDVLSLTAVATVAGRAARNVDGFVAMLQRLLNVESYPVLELIDGGTRLRFNKALAREQFLLEDQ